MASVIMAIRHWIRVVGALAAGLGILCLPSVGRSPWSYGSGFSMLSDTGSLSWVALILIIGGAILFFVSFIGSE